MAIPVAALVSGGVDSSVALCLLKEQGYDITAFYLKIWLEDELAFLGNCPWQEDLDYVQKVCAQLKVPLQVVSLQKEYWSQVVRYTIGEIKAGRTPNPDILCNQRIKFGAFFDIIGDAYQFVASGHYARVERKDGLTYLCTAVDQRKDQTYFLSHLNQTQLSRALFPIGHLHKSQVRELAYTFNLPNKDRKDSQGICFLGKLKFPDFVKYHLGEQEGSLVEYETGQTVGSHKGFWFYTIGQRQGLGLAGGPWYVVAKDPSKNIIYISKQYNTEEKERRMFYMTDVNWIPFMPDFAQNFAIKLRHGPTYNTAVVKEIDVTQLQNKLFRVQLGCRDHALAPGQFAVLYDAMHTYCFGSGVIAGDTFAI